MRARARAGLAHARASSTQRLVYHYEATLAATRYRSKDRTAAEVFAANGGFVTEWARPESPDDIKYPKPDINTLIWLETQVENTGGMGDFDHR